MLRGLDEEYQKWDLPTNVSKIEYMQSSKMHAVVGNTWRRRESRLIEIPLCHNQKRRHKCNRNKRSYRIMETSDETVKLWSRPLRSKTKIKIYTEDDSGNYCNIWA